MEQVLGEDEVIDCACLEWGNEALKLPATAHGNRHVGADGLHREHSPLMQPPWEEKRLYILNAFQVFTLSKPWIMIYYYVILYIYIYV